jgi:hypothetical protein
MSFKPKTNKKINIDEKTITTLDTKHKLILNEIQEQENNIPKLQKIFEDYKHRIKNKTYNSVDEKLDILDKIKSLKLEIYIIKNKRNDYFLNNSKYIFNYFENKKDICKDTNSKKVLNNFFEKYNQKKNETNNDEINDVKKYFINVDTNFIDINDYIEEENKCYKCNGELISIDHEGIMVCKNCYIQINYLIEHEKPSYKEPPKEVCFYAYKRINHFREILAQFQAKETTQIDDNILENIKKQIKKERITLEELTNDKTKSILKNLGYNKYYEHIPFIKEKLGIKPPTMSIELENTLCSLFLEIQKPYSKFCPNERVNFLNYYYVLFKMCELLGEDEYLPHFYMLKDPVKRMEQDEIWKKICHELNWEFIDTP